MNAGTKRPQLKEFYYRVPWQPQSCHPGAHRAHQYNSGGFEVIGHNPFSDGQDPRRFDIRASIRDPLQRLMVRRYRHFSSVNVIMLADMSASTHFLGQAHNKREVMADFANSLAISAIRSGDKFGFYGADEIIQAPLIYPPGRIVKVGEEIATRIRDAASGGVNSHGLIDAANALTRQKSLIFLVSDFYFEKKLLDSLLSVLSMHCVIPVVLRDSLENEKIPSYGMARFYDSESGRRKNIFLTPKIKKTIQAIKEKIDNQLRASLGSFGLRPLVLKDQFVANEVTEYFMRY